jgi:hypothetical protein
MTYIGPYSVEGLLVTHPWLHDVILQEFIRMHLSARESKDITLASNIYARSIPLLKREALLNMSRYGVPYNPLRPALLRTSANAGQILRWLFGLPQ